MSAKSAFLLNSSLKEIPGHLNDAINTSLPESEQKLIVVVSDTGDPGY